LAVFFGMANELAAVSGTRTYSHNFPATALHTTCILKVFSAGIKTKCFAVTAADMPGYMASVADVAASSCVAGAV
jgi:hypothetical protein